MKTPKLCCVLLSVIISAIHARSTPEEIRKALGASPVFSHRRDSAVPIPQNVNVVLPASDPDAWAPPPVRSPAQRRAERRNGRRSKNTIRAGKPPQMSLSDTQERFGIVSSGPVTDVNDRFLNSNAEMLQNQAAFGDPLECSFQIPSFLMPDPDPSHINSDQHCPSFLLPGPSINPGLVTLLVEHWTGVSQPANTVLNRVRNQISQIEFEQKCLVPALRAHVLGGSACRSRELTVYLEWLLYLRQKLFNI